MSIWQCMLLKPVMPRNQAQLTVLCRKKTFTRRTKASESLIKHDFNITITVNTVRCAAVLPTATISLTGEADIPPCRHFSTKLHSFRSLFCRARFKITSTAYPQTSTKGTGRAKSSLPSNWPVSGPFMANNGSDCFRQNRLTFHQPASKVLVWGEGQKLFCAIASIYRIFGSMVTVGIEHGFCTSLPYPLSCGFSS